MKEYEYNKDTLIAERSLQKYFYILIAGLMFIPLIFISDEMVVSNEYLFSLSHMFNDYLRNIDRAAELANSTGIANKVRFIYNYSIVVGAILFFVMLYVYGKAYLCSLGYLNNCKKVYYIKTIQNKKVDRPFNLVIGNFLLMFVIFETIHLGYFIDLITEANITSYYYNNSFAVTIWCSIGSIPMGYMSYIILELISHIRKYLKLKFN
ncbi:hypothetical protein [Arcobacter roscoffensis]|uniref:Uncharacterized protein n=1 Tax=Arcobacter roscoffensis TaxID=2961520 RepID=A0ABY5E520_9BACT|nr:hypothetical protein [Arcobacter roscoffensis]UTJ07259.1 hypothetical protein NJU99_03985 [Arcobacter roscoffensis]